MKTPRIVTAIGHIDDDLVNGAACTKVRKKNLWLKWGSLAACFAIMIISTVVAIPMMFFGDDPDNSPSNNSPIVTPNNGLDNECKYESGYFYQINDGAYSIYVGGKVIAEGSIGNKIADVNLTAGWKDDKGDWKSETETLRGEIYEINGVTNDVAVALKFIDKGQAVTTTHYYVIINPTADLTPVKDYIITPITPNYPDDEGTVNKGEILEDTLEKYYDYGISSGAFSTYISGKVIDAEKVGAKLKSVTVTGGWKNEAGKWISTEELNAEVYEITRIDSSIAVALKFIDQGEAVTTTHYYVMMNPAVDLSIVKEYAKEPIVQNKPDNEMVGEVNE